MKDGFKVIDADRHILEPTDLYQNYLPEKFKHRVRLAGPNQTVREVDGKPVSDSAARPGRVMEDFGYIFSSSKRWRACARRSRYSGGARFSRATVRARPTRCGTRRKARK